MATTKLSQSRKLVLNTCRLRAVEVDATDPRCNAKLIMRGIAEVRHDGGLIEGATRLRFDLELVVNNVRVDILAEASLSLILIFGLVELQYLSETAVDISACIAVHVHLTDY